MKCIIEEHGYICYGIILAAYIVEDIDFKTSGEKCNGKTLSKTVEQVSFREFSSFLSELILKALKRWEFLTVIGFSTASAHRSEIVLFFNYYYLFFFMMT